MLAEILQSYMYCGKVVKVHFGLQTEVGTQLASKSPSQYMYCVDLDGLIAA